jgi:hypothetical protein
MGRRAKSLPPIYERQLREAYGDFASPNFGFVWDAMSNEAAATVFRELAESYTVVDDTDVNYQVCFTYVVHLERLVVVKLSMVGPYALVAAYDADGQSPGVLLDERHPASAAEARITDVVVAHGFTIIPAGELDCAVPLVIREDRDEVSLYAALFEPEGEMPWLR